jgi:hypothetical protein
MPEEAIYKEELYFWMCLRKDTVVGRRRAPGAGSKVNRSRNGWGRGMGKRASQVQDLPLAQQRSTCPREASSGQIIARHYWHSAVPPPMSNTRTLASSNSKRGTQAAVCKSCWPCACRCCSWWRHHSYCRSWSVSRARASACYSRSRSCCCCRSWSVSRARASACYSRSRSRCCCRSSFINQAQASTCCSRSRSCHCYRVAVDMRSK